MSKRRMSFESDDDQDQDEEEASNSRERKLARRKEAPIPAEPNQEEEGEAPINEEEGQIPAQDLLFKKTLTHTEATCSQLSITGAHKATLMAFLTDAERDILAKNGGLMVGATDTNGNGVEYALELKRNSMTYFNGWRQVARANQVNIGDSVEGFGYRAAGGNFRLKLNIIRNPNQEEEEEAPIPNQEEGEAPIPANPNEEEVGQIPAQDLLFEKTLTSSDTKADQLWITGAHRARLMAFLTDTERATAEKIGVGLMVPTTDANGNGVEYVLELKKNRATYFNGWRQVARANQVNIGDSVQGFGYRAAGEFRLNLNIITN